MVGSFGYGAGGNGQGPGGEEDTRPFRFIREDQLNKLPILFRGMSPAQCALVLAYLPAEWASKVLGVLDPGVQTAIMGELSQAREVPPDVVDEIENQIKSKLPYLVGGVEWIQSVYQLTQPQTQKALLGTLNQQSPELAQTLRQKTFFLEDLAVVSAGALRMLIQEVGYPAAAMALRDEKPESRDGILKRLPAAMREILQQELELAGDDRRAMIEAKVRLLDVGRRMLAEGRITLPEAQTR
jgi:flagellar motor switch protein FliG